jgi:hypothetical protein
MISWVRARLLSSLVQLRIAMWTGVARDTRPCSVIIHLALASTSRGTFGASYELQDSDRVRSRAFGFFVLD